MRTSMCLIALALSLSATSAFAAPRASCADRAENAAALLESKGNTNRLNFMESSSRLVKQNGNTLVYAVEINEQYNDGAATEEFPASLYVITAIGTQANCKIKNIEFK